MTAGGILAFPAPAIPAVFAAGGVVPGHGARRVYVIALLLVFPLLLQPREGWAGEGCVAGLFLF